MVLLILVLIENFVFQFPALRKAAGRCTQLFTNIMNKTFIIFFLFHLVKIFGQNEEKYSFKSSPSFHNGFKIEINNKNEIIFITENNYYVLDSLKKNYTSFPNFSSQIKIFEENKFLLSNSKIEKQISIGAKKDVTKILEQINLVCPNVDPIKFGYDGIVFTSYLPNGKFCKFWSPSEKTEISNLVLKLLSKVSEIYTPNAFIDNYIYETKQYLLKEIKSFSVKSYNPLIIKLYQMSDFGCGNFEKQIKSLPDKNEIYVDITELSPYYFDENCLIETINKKFKSVKIIQSKEIDKFNKL